MKYLKFETIFNVDIALDEDNTLSPYEINRHRYELYARLNEMKFDEAAKTSSEKVGSFE